MLRRTQGPYLLHFCRKRKRDSLREVGGCIPLVSAIDVKVCKCVDLCRVVSVSALLLQCVMQRAKKPYLVHIYMCICVRGCEDVVCERKSTSERVRERVRVRECTRGRGWVCVCDIHVYPWFVCYMHTCQDLSTYIYIYICTSKQI